MKKIKKKRIFIGILTIIILVLILLLLYKKHNRVTISAPEIIKKYFAPVDTVYMDEEWYSKEFKEEMMRGFQGDFTLEQVDSMRRSWAKLDSIEASKR